MMNPKDFKDMIDGFDDNFFILYGINNDKKESIKKIIVDDYAFCYLYWHDKKEWCRKSSDLSLIKFYADCCRKAGFKATIKRQRLEYNRFELQIESDVF